MPGGDKKKELLEHLDKVPTYVQRLQFSVKDHTVGKAATFTKVDNVITETKNLMNVISKVVTTCFECATKVNITLVFICFKIAILQSVTLSVVLELYHRV